TMSYSNFKKRRRIEKKRQENKERGDAGRTVSKKARSIARSCCELRPSSQIMKRCFDKLTPIF
ncbi:hypothetical protein, partial [Klebsiella sp. FR21TRMT6331]|uniref:hypothetical protein n=1 Tax=Klebsiella sp. FR21TRMT6331 TaxID=3381299 RepID=UPI003A974955